MACDVSGVSAARILKVAGLATLAGLGLSACASAPSGLRSVSEWTPPAAPQASRAQASRAEAGASRSPIGRYKVGAPYQAGGVWYVPAEQPDYDSVGLASWYGDQFDGRPTANGEIFHMAAATGAHATLPMPSIVEVTNLENGRTLRVRLNDRGPFHPGRIIDLSRGAATELGFLAKGTAKVRVRYVGPAAMSTEGMDAPLTVAAAGSQPTFTPPRSAAALTMASAPGGAAAEEEGGALKSAFVSYAIQAGAFAERANAERAAARLAAAGETAISPMQRGGSTLYRVTVGRYPQMASAEEARGKVTALGFAQARVAVAP